MSARVCGTGSKVCAGITDLVLTLYPRVCGEHTPRLTQNRGLGGSSPRVRGTLGFYDANVECHRFIPACAGNTSSNPERPALRSVHPRVCGEHVGNLRRDQFASGSSPRVRGTLLCASL
ncbi:hypothetical protein GFGA_1c0113 [Gluconobacter frateurii NBRC 103465]|nr:hypothetical protein GFGA_1c0113 [Gluconobacter frateurii NBRC 103465]